MILRIGETSGYQRLDYYEERKHEQKNNNKVILGKQQTQNSVNMCLFIIIAVVAVGMEQA